MKSDSEMKREAEEKAARDDDFKLLCVQKCGDGLGKTLAAYLLETNKESDLSEVNLAFAIARIWQGHDFYMKVCVVKAILMIIDNKISKNSNPNWMGPY